MVYTLGDSLVQLTCFCQRKSKKKLLQILYVASLFAEKVGERERNRRGEILTAAAIKMEYSHLERKAYGDLKG